MQPSPILQKALRRLALTTKNSPHNYYKGNKTGSMGRHTKFGNYVIDYSKVRSYACPVLDDFELTPFVPTLVDDKKKKSKTAKADEAQQSPEEEIIRNPKLDGETFLRVWKEAGGEPQ